MLTESTGSSATANDLGSLLTLDWIGDDRFRARMNDANLDDEIFGGQYLGQSIWAAMATADGRVPHTLYGFFLRAASARLPLDIVVERTRQGRSFTHRRVTAVQDGREMFRAEVSLHDPIAHQPEHQRAMPQVPSPQALRSLREIATERADSLGSVATARLTLKSLFDTYPVDPEAGLGAVATQPGGHYWVKALLDGAGDARLHYAALAYLSDVMANMSSRAMHAPNGFDGAISALSMNHGIWFHHPPRSDGWLLFDLESCFAGGGIGTNRGLIYGADGRLHASVMQDAMIRYR